MPEADCIAQRTAACLADVTTWQLPGIVAGRLAYDAMAAQACIDRVGKQPCGLRSSAQPFCDAMFQPRVAAGGACLRNQECVSGVCDRTSSCPGTCVAFGQAGADCTKYPCDPATTACDLKTRVCTAKQSGAGCSQVSDCLSSDYCVEMTSGAPCPQGSTLDRCSCRPRSSLGSACRYGVECAEGAGCAGGTCRTTGAAGDPCSYAQGVGCADGLGCIIADGRRSALAGTCGPMLSSGTSCFWVECQPGLDCVGSSIDETAPHAGACQPKAQPSSMCRLFGCTLAYDCSSGQCAARPGVGERCNAIGGAEKFCYGPDIRCNKYTDGMCTAPPAVGESCWEWCNDETYCDNNLTNKCLLKKAAGERCLDDRQCSSGLCSLSTCAVPCAPDAL